MDIENVIEKLADDYVCDNYITGEEVIESEATFIKKLNKETTGLYFTYETLRNEEVTFNIETAYGKGFREGIKFLNTILNLGTLKEGDLKETHYGKRVGQS